MFILVILCNLIFVWYLPICPSVCLSFLYLYINCTLCSESLFIFVLFHVFYMPWFPMLYPGCAVQACLMILINKSIILTSICNGPTKIAIVTSKMVGCLTNKIMLVPVYRRYLRNKLTKMKHGYYFICIKAKQKSVFINQFKCQVFWRMNINIMFYKLFHNNYYASISAYCI